MSFLNTISAKIKGKLRAEKRRFINRNLDEVVQVLRMHYGPKSINLATLDAAVVPEKISGFHDLAFLFASHQANRGVIAQDFDEAAYIWSVIASRQPKTLVEIGRWLGGSTVLLASAGAQHGGDLFSVDLKIKAPEYADDMLIEQIMRRLGLKNYRLVIGDSRTFQPPSPVNFVLIDGDHSYEGVKADFENMAKYLARDADVLFHDACATRRFATRDEHVARYMIELGHRGDLSSVGEIGSIKHFRWNI